MGALFERSGRALTKRVRVAALLALMVVPSVAWSALLKKGDKFLPFGLRAIDGTHVIVTVEDGALTLIRERIKNGKAEKITTHPAAVLIDFWATWCVPCRASMPYMQKLNDKFQPQDGQDSGGLNLFGIAFDIDGSAVVKPFFSRLKFTYPMLADPIPGLTDSTLLRTTSDMKEPYGAEEIPVVYLIDTKGRIAYAHMGFNKKKMADLEKAVVAAVLEPKK